MVAPFGSHSADAFEERAAIVEANGIPRDRVEGFARLDTLPRPAEIALWRWRRIFDDAERFLDGWGRKAATHSFSLGRPDVNSCLMPEIHLGYVGSRTFGLQTEQIHTFLARNGGGELWVRNGYLRRLREFRWDPDTGD